MLQGVCVLFACAWNRARGTSVVRCVDYLRANNHFVLWEVLKMLSFSFVRFVLWRKLYIIQWYYVGAVYLQAKLGLQVTLFIWEEILTGSSGQSRNTWELMCSELNIPSTMLCIKSHTYWKSLHGQRLLHLFRAELDHWSIPSSSLPELRRSR